MKDAVDLLGERITELEAKLKAAESERDSLRGKLQDYLYCLTIWAGSEKKWNGNGLDAAKRLRDALLAQEGGDNG